MVATVDMFFDTRWQSHFGQLPYKNFPKSVAQEIGASRPDYDAQECPDGLRLLRGFTGGNCPQLFVNLIGDLIQKGQLPQGPVLIGGAEANHTFDTLRRAKQHKQLPQKGWGDDPDLRDSIPKPEVTQQ